MKTFITINGELIGLNQNQVKYISTLKAQAAKAFETKTSKKFIKQVLAHVDSLYQTIIQEFLSTLYRVDKVRPQRYLFGGKGCTTRV